MRVLIGMLTAICMLAPLSAETQMKAAIKSKLAMKSMLFDIANVNNDFMVAVGERGHILRAENTDTWVQVDVIDGFFVVVAAGTFCVQQLPTFRHYFTYVVATRIKRTRIVLTTVA